MDRRLFLRTLGALGCSAAAHPAITAVTLAAARADSGAPLGDNRLVVTILRGALDGLYAVAPVEDPALAALRPRLAAVPGYAPLAGGFALHPGLADLLPLWTAGELAFVHATSTPYRDKRSHFDGQDLLEAGTGDDLPASMRREGWLNRMLQAVPGIEAETAFAVGREALPMLEGRAPSLSWSPEQRLPLSPQGERLLEALYHDDPLFRDAGADAIFLSADAAAMAEAVPDQPEAEEPAMADSPAPALAPRQLADVDALVDYAADKLAGRTRIAAFSLSGWDTHRGQAAAIAVPFARLSRTVTRLRSRLGPEVWGRTLFMAMTEFGRTVRENGTAGTDHGTGGLVILAGGSLKRAAVWGAWPGLSEDALYAGRDLMPTSDVREWAAWGVRNLYGLDIATLEGAVFPGLRMGADPGFTG